MDKVFQDTEVTLACFFPLLWIFLSIIPVFVQLSPGLGISCLLECSDALELSLSVSMCIHTACMLSPEDLEGTFSDDLE